MNLSEVDPGPASPRLKNQASTLTFGNCNLIRRDATSRRPETETMLSIGMIAIRIATGTA
jgi:hypothetical protein